MASAPPLILASASPQRRSLLEAFGVRFETIPSSVEESIHPEKDPAKRAQILATLKARDVASTHLHSIVIGCDTLVVAHNGTLLEKPLDEKDARRMLLLQSGKTSLVYSGLTVIGADGKAYEGLSTSKVTFGNVSPEMADWWIASGNWKDRSGGFQIDGAGQMLIETIEGDWTGVVGLPIYVLRQLLEKAGVRLWK